MRFWFFSTGPNHARRHRRPAPSVRPFLESLEDRCLPSANTIASVSHDQVHTLQDVFQQQTTQATVTLQVERVVLGILQQFAPQVPQLKPVIASLTNAIPMQQATVQTLQNETNLLNQLDDLQDQVIISNGTIQTATALVPVSQQLGNQQAVNTLDSIIAMNQAAVQAVQPQITAVEVEVSTFI